MAVALCLLPDKDAARAQAEKPSEDPIQQLLDGDGPPADWRDYLRKHPTPRLQPSAAASDDDLIEFWEWAPRDTVPDTQTTNRLVEVCEHQPREFSALARFLPTDNREAADRLKGLHDKLSAKHNEEGNALAEQVRKWLMLNSEFFRDELVAAAVEGSTEAIERLIKIDSALAQRSFQEHVADKNSETRAFALSALISHSFPDLDARTRTDYLEKLKQITVESGASVQAKRTALEAVMANNWSEKEKWFLDLFHHRALSQEEEYSRGLAPLSTIVAKQPDYWIPKIVPLLKSQDNAVRATAAECLVGFQLEHARRDALMPLLPWIADPKWTSTSDANGRLRLLQSLGLVELPESVPYLRKAVRSDRAYELKAVAEALAHYEVRDAAPSLKEAGVRELDSYHRREIVRALLKLDGFKPEEIAQGIRDYALRVAALPDEEWTDQSWEKISKSPRPLVLDLGHEASYAEIRSDATAKAVTKEIQQLERTNQRAAEILWKALTRWPTPSAYAASIDRLRSGHFTATWLLRLLDAKTQLPEALKEVRDLRGTPYGVQAALSRDRSMIDSVLKSDDADAKRALVACARAARIDLPLQLLTLMLDSQDKELITAADRYLETIDSVEARAELKKRTANRRRREFGTQLNFSAFEMEKGEISRTEKQLRELLDHEDPPREIYALLSEGNFGSDGQRALLVYDGRTVLRCADGNGRISERDVPSAEFSALRDWIEKNNVADLPPYDEGTMDGIQLQYVHLTSDAGERVFMNNPPGGPMGGASFSPGISEPRPDPIVYAELTRRMMKLNQVPMPVLYPALKGLEGFQVVQLKEDGRVTALRVRNGQLFAGVLVSYDKPTEWHRITESGFAKEFVVEKTAVDPKTDPTETDKGFAVHEGPLAGKRLQADWGRKDGLWALKDGKGNLIAKGFFARPILCPGGEWIVVAKTFGTNLWGEPNGVVRIHLPDKRIYPVDLPPADNFNPIVWIEARKRVLLHQVRDWRNGKAGPEKSEFYLLDPVTGAHEKVTGEMRPFFDAEKHDLQPTGNPNEFWATRHSSVVDPQLRTTAIGRFDSHDFRFTPVVTCPDMQFDSDAVFVDEPAGAIWIAVNGDLLRLSLPSKSPPSK